MWYRRAIANRRDFFRARALNGTAIAARTIKAPGVARVHGTAVKLGALHSGPGALSYWGHQCRSTEPGTVEGKARTAVALLIAGVVAMLAVSSPRDALSAEYTLMPSPQTVHIGHFSAALKPVLTINSGDIVTIETATSLDPAEIDQSGAVPPSVVPEYQRAIHREVKDRGPSGHVLTGPIFVNGVQPGDTLEVRILEIDLAVDYGHNRQRPYAGALPDEVPGVFRRIIPIDRKAKATHVAPGVVVPVDRPFFRSGTLMPPRVRARSIFPRSRLAIAASSSSSCART